MRYDYSSIGFITFDCLGWPYVQMPNVGADPNLSHRADRILSRG